jgi:hypothetical protein
LALLSARASQLASHNPVQIAYCHEGDDLLIGNLDTKYTLDLAEEIKGVEVIV